jgi:thiol-disulfide isomerase/thioredoxin
VRTTIGDGVRARRVRAAPLRGRGWLNTGGRTLSLADLRGTFVLLDFWTFCCVNCLHVLDELRELEEAHRDVLVVIGVHSPKFPHEADPHALAEAVERYEVHHPVLDDPDLTTWQAYTARAWPTLVLIDPEGYVVAHLSGEGHAAGLEALLSTLLPQHEANGTLHRGDGPYVPPPPAATNLRYPGGLLRLPDGVLVSDTAHHQIVRLADDLSTEVARYGTGERGLRDGTEPRFSSPLGLLALPAEVAARVGYDVVVADSTNHALRGLSLATGEVTTVAGTGRQLRLRTGAGPAREQDLSTPWDVAWWQDRVVVAMAGVHQLWWFDPVAATVGVLAGTSHEGLVDGAPGEAWFAQPSGLSVDRSLGADALWVADSETSALRRVSADGVETVVGEGLFDFGHRDGPAGQARLQHPLAVEVLADGSVAIADTYNGAIRRYADGQVSTIAEGLSEPAALVAAGDVLLVAEGHRITRVPIGAAARVDGPAQRTTRPAVELAPGPVRVVVRFTPPPGHKLDDSFGDPVWTSVSAAPEPVSGGGRRAGLERTVELAQDGTLSVSAQAAACDEADGVCRLYQQDWGVPYRLVAGGGSELVLDLAAHRP